MPKIRMLISHTTVSEVIDITDTTNADDGNQQTPAESATERALLRTVVARTLSADNAFGSVQVLSHEAAERIFTPERRALIQILSEFDVDSQRELARRLDRDPGAVQRDIAELTSAGVIEIEQHGRSKRPVLTHDTIMIEPLIAPDRDEETAYSVEHEP